MPRKKKADVQYHVLTRYNFITIERPWFCAFSCETFEEAEEYINRMKEKDKQCSVDQQFSYKIIAAEDYHKENIYERRAKRSVAAPTR